VALDVLHRVEEGQAWVAPSLDSSLRRSGINRHERALATELVYGVLRWQGALDARLARYSRQPLEKLEPTLRLALRLGAYQLLGNLRIPPHAAVTLTVDIVRERKGRGAAGLINAVLRTLERARGAPLDPTEALPAWLADRLRTELGADVAASLARASVEQPMTVLRLIPGRGRSREELISELKRAQPSSTVEPGRWSPLAVRTRGLGPISILRAFREGRVAIQDEGAQLCTLLLDVAPGHKLLDACAGRGGKTMLLASLASGRATVHAADRHAGKLEFVNTEAKRLGLPPVRAVAVDLELGAAGLEPPYDRILLDAPCSGIGTIARRPEIKWRLAPGDVRRLVEVQARLIDRCLGLLGPTGVLVYCACSPLEEEGPGQARAAVERAGGPGSLALTREIRLFPHVHGTDGFYAARLARNSARA
jgi:16S rRNA (cytosine967-C5)-methyltransferase